MVMSSVRWGCRLLVGTLTATLCVLGVVPAATAESTRYISVYPSQGDFGDAIDIRVPTGGFCPQRADRAIVRMTGPGLEAPFNLIGNSRITSFNSFQEPGTTIIPLLWNWYDAQGNVEPAPVKFDGRYTIALHCMEGISLEVIGESIAEVEIDQASMTYRVVSPQSAAPRGDAVNADAQSQSGVDTAAGTEQPDAVSDEDPAAGVSGEGARGGSEVGSSSGGSEAGDEVPQGSAGSPGEASPATAAAASTAPADSSTTRTLLIAGGALLLAAAAFLGGRSRRASAEK